MSARLCPSCRNTLPRDARFCRSCGASAPVRPEISCTACAHANPADSAFCRSCGQALTPAEPAVSPAEPTFVQQAPQSRRRVVPRASTGVVTAIILGVLLVAGGGVAAALLARGSSHAPTSPYAGTIRTTTTVTESPSSWPTPTGSTAAAGVTSSVGTTGETTGKTRVFHTESGNVACEVQPDGARCAVASSKQTFVMPQEGGRAYVQTGLALPVSSGSFAPYGTSVSVASVTCAIPRQNEPKGIICTNTRSRHGFEASAVPSRQWIR